MADLLQIGHHPLSRIRNVTADKVLPPHGIAGGSQRIVQGVMWAVARRATRVGVATTVRCSRSEAEESGRGAKLYLDQVIAKKLELQDPRP